MGRRCESRRPGTESHTAPSKHCAATDWLTCRERDHRVAAGTSLLRSTSTVLISKLFRPFFNGVVSLHLGLIMRAQAAIRIVKLSEKDAEGIESIFIIRLARCLRQVPVRQVGQFDVQRSHPHVVQTTTISLVIASDQYTSSLGSVSPDWALELIR